jgi:hypothetical protein
MSPRPNLLIKLAVGLVALGGLGYLFVRSLETTRTEPYQVNRANLAGWELALDTMADAPNAPLLILRTDIALVSNLFRQVFLRTMESMSTPSSSSIAVVLHGEFASALASRMTPDQLLTAARAAGLEGAAHEPRCLVHQRISEPGSTRQAYAALISSPSIVSFRQALAAQAEGGLDAAALTPVMLVGASDEGFHRWLPMRAGEQDCVAPITTAAP